LWPLIGVVVSQPQEEPQTPPAKVLLPLGSIILVAAILTLVFAETHVVSTALISIVALMGAGIIWQGFKNLKRERT
jgi:uncharacterized membrane protein